MRSIRISVVGWPSFPLAIILLVSSTGCFGIDENTDTLNPQMGTEMEMDADPHEMTPLNEMPTQGPMLGETVEDGES